MKYRRTSIGPAEQVFSHGEFWDGYSKEWRYRYAESIAGNGGLLGEEWGPSEAARRHLEEFLFPHASPESCVLEMGPGGGKYTQHLAGRYRNLVLVDVSREMLDRASQVVPRGTRLEHIDGTSLHPIADSSMDAVCSFDVLIHVDPEELIRYLAEFNRILRPGGTLVISDGVPSSVYGVLSMFRQLRDHNPTIGQRWGGKLFPIEPSRMRTYAELCGFEPVRIHENWEDPQAFYVFRRAGPAYLWRFALNPHLYERVEVGAKVGGSPALSICIGSLIGEREPRTLLIGSVEDLCEVAAFDGTGHPSIPAAVASGGDDGAGWVAYPLIRGASWSRYTALTAVRHPALPPFHATAGNVGELLQAAVQAVEQGCVHRHLSPDWVVYHLETGKFAIPGWERSQDADLIGRTRDSLATLAGRLAEDLRAMQEAGAVQIPPIASWTGLKAAVGL